LNPALVCTFETGEEWKETSKKEQGFNCISCHMPTLKRPISKDGPEFESHRHHFPGSGIPKFDDMPIEGLQGLEITPSKLNVNYNPGDTLRFLLTLQNLYAGHSLPTGDPERFYLVSFRFCNGEETLKEQDFRIGEKWQWYPVAKKISDNNIKSLEKREFVFTTSIPDRKGLELIVEVTKHRITEENAEYNKLPDSYPKSISIFRETYEVSILP
jgi:hypothetical protein